MLYSIVYFCVACEGLTCRLNNPKVLPQVADVLCTHPMFGPESGKEGWNGLPLVYEKVRIRNHSLCDRYLAIFQAEVKAPTTYDSVFYYILFYSSVKL